MSACVKIPWQGAGLDGDLELPEQASGLVIFAHGSGSSRLSPRNRLVARRLEQGGLATLLLDLLTPLEEAHDATGVYRFDIELLAERLEAALHWAASKPALRALPTGLFGASTGAGAALVAAARHPDRVRAVVSRGGRPDLAGPAWLRQVLAPTLLIVGGRDDVVLGLNQQAADHLGCPHRLEVVPGATHLFSEPGTLEHVGELACDWFLRYLAPAPVPGP